MAKYEGRLRIQKNHDDGCSAADSNYKQIISFGTLQHWFVASACISYNNYGEHLGVTSKELGVAQKQFKFVVPKSEIIV